MFGCSKELSECDGSFEHPKQIFKLMGKKIITCPYLDQEINSYNPKCPFCGTLYKANRTYPDQSLHCSFAEYSIKI